MKQLLLATATFVGMSSAALAAEAVALTDSQLDKVTAGVTVTTLLLPVALSQAGVAVGGIAAVGPSGFATNMVLLTITAP